MQWSSILQILVWGPFCCLGKDCTELYRRGITVDGIYNVTLKDGGPAISVPCSMQDHGTGWTVIQRRRDGSEDFFRTWSDYKAGFGSLDNEFWLGNDNLHRLTSQDKYELQVILEDFEGGSATARYTSFTVGPETKGYELEVYGYSGTAGDSLSYHNGQKFTTKDVDNDRLNGNCATKFRGAWWYKACHYSNLNCVYQLTSKCMFGKGVIWRSFRGQHYSLKTVNMMIKSTSKSTDLLEYNQQLETVRIYNYGAHNQTVRDNKLTVGRFRRKVYGRLWENAKVPYRFETTPGKNWGSYQKQGEEIVKAALALIQKQTCLKFNLVDGSYNSYHLIFSNGDGCFSIIGRAGRKGQFVRLQHTNKYRTCIREGAVAHEVLHALGMVHEQTRSDRDDYVSINFDNLRPEGHSEYRKWKTKNVQPYDVHSLMHYGAKEFRINYKKPTISVKAKFLENLIGNRKEMSYYDVKTLNIMYNCSAGCNLQCQNDGYSIRDSQGTCRCTCPDYFKGTHCELIDDKGGCSGKYKLQDAGDVVTIFGESTKERDDRQCVYLIESSRILRVHFNAFFLKRIFRCYATLEVRFNLIGQLGITLCGTRPPEDFSTLDGSGMKKLLLVFRESRSFRHSAKYNISIFASDPTDPCLKNPCPVGAACIFQAPSSFRCLCPPGKAGKDCNVKDPCVPNPCHEKATCSGVGDSFKCKCPSGLFGTACDSAEDKARLESDFEESFGFLKNVNGDNFDWVMQQGSSGVANTGPFGGYRSKKYAFVPVKSVQNMRRGSHASLVSNYLSVDQGRCFQFNYHMYGATMGKFAVILESEDTSKRPAEHFAKKGNQGTSWKYHSFNLPASSKRQRIVFKYTKYGRLTAMAIDNVVTFPGKCAQVLADTYDGHPPIPTRRRNNKSSSYHHVIKRLETLGATGRSSTTAVTSSYELVTIVSIFGLICHL